MNSQGKGSTSDAVAGMEYASKKGAKIINSSFGCSSYSDSVKDAVEAVPAVEAQPHRQGDDGKEGDAGRHAQEGPGQDRQAVGKDRPDQERHGPGLVPAAQSQGRGGAPEDIILSDRVIQVLGLLWAVTFAIGVYA